MKPLKSLSSSSFRMALATFTAVWLTSAIFLLLMMLFVKQVLVKDIAADIIEASDALIADVTAQSFFHPEIYPAFKHVPVYDDDWQHDELSSFLPEYIGFLRNELKTQSLTTSEQLAIYGRQYVLGELPRFNPRNVPFQLIVHLMDQEFPEQFHPWLEERLEERLEQRLDADQQTWPNYPRVKFSTVQLVYFYLEQDDVIGDQRLCIQLTDGNGEVIYSTIKQFVPGNISLDDKLSTLIKSTDTSPDTSPDERHVKQVTTTFNGPPSACLLRTIGLGDNGILRLGEPFEQGYIAIEGMKHYLLMALLCTLFVSVACGFWIANRAVSKITTINQTCNKISSGDLQVRIPQNQSGDDYDQLAEHINRMLDRIVELLESVKRVSDNIAHDLKTPLVHVQNQLELLLQTPNPTHEAIAEIINENNRVIACFNALLRIGELEQGAQRQAFESFEFADVIEILIDLYEPAIEHKAITFSYDRANLDCPVFGDKHQWLQAVTNLLDNGIKFSPQGGVISLGLKRLEDRIELVIKDSGPGIESGQFEQVFERFYRLDSSRHTQGFGLGLSLVKAVCQLYNANIELCNDNGLVVTVAIPLSDSIPV